jgi:RNA polymerase sigma-70 factor (ECF subfamily)
MKQGRDPDFTTTHWSLVLAVMDTAPARAFDALEKLCTRYWFPIYAFIRRNGHDAHQAEDLTQSFFQFVIERRMLSRVQRDRGRFRNFILASLANFLHNHHDHVSAAKRGGSHVIVSLDETNAEEILAQEPENTSTPDHAFERRWAVTLIRHVLKNLRAEHAERGRLAVFDALQPHLTGEPAQGEYECLAAQLDMETGALKVALHRLRRRFGKLLRKEVAYTVARPEEVEEEIRHLLTVLAHE